MAANGRNAASPADQFAMLGRYNLWSLVRSYLLKMLSAGPADRMKGLLLDRDTMRIVSTTVGKADLQAHEVYIHRQIRDLATMTEHGELSGIAFLRKTSQNIDWLKRHLKTPKMRDFRLFFSYIIEDGEMGNIASVDSKSLVQEVQEFYADYVVLDPHHFLIPVPNDACFLDPAGSSLHWRDGMERIMEGLGALLLGLRCRPVIRFAQSSPAAGKIADALYQHMYQQERELFAFGNMRTPAADHPLVLILDRSEDPVTPLLTQWTYQAMIHELLGLQDNICKLEGTAENPEAPAELKEGVVLSCCQDEFFGKHLYDNWGDLAAALQSEVQRAQKGSKQELQSLEDLKAAVLMVGDVNQQKSIAQKHVQISSELGRIIRSRQLFEVSEVEQELAGPGGGSASVDAQLVREKLQLPGLSDDDRVRLAMLYALRYPQDAAQILSIKTELTDRHGCSRERVKAVQAVLDQMGGKLSKQLHGQGSGMGGLFKRAVTNMRGVENVFTQHKPLLHTLLTDLLQGNLSTAAYPFKGLELAGRGVPRLVVVFVVGGSTYEEAKIVHELNVANQGRCIALLGGNSLLNSRTFINTLLKTSSGSGGSHTIDLN